MKRQRANIISDALKSAKETMRLKKYIENKDLNDLTENMSPEKRTAALKRPIGKIYREHKAAKRRQDLKNAQTYFPEPANLSTVPTDTKKPDQDIDAEPRFSRTGRQLRKKIIFDI